MNTNKVLKKFTPIGVTGNHNIVLPNYSGIKKFNQERPEWDDLLINSGLFKFRGTTDPTWRDWTVDGKTFQILKFNTNDEIFFSCQIPHTYKEGTDIRPHVHWSPANRGNEESGSTVDWKLDYIWANPMDDTFDTAGTISLKGTCSGTDNKHEIGASSEPYIDGTDKMISSMLFCRLYRGSDDTWSGTDSDAPGLLQFDFHHEVDTSGSRQEWIK